MVEGKCYPCIILVLFIAYLLHSIMCIATHGAFVLGGSMHNDLELIVKEFPADYDCLRVYAIGDVHVGSEQFDETAIKKTIRYIEEDPFACVVIAGDLGDFGLKNSVSNVYKQVLNVREQLEYLYKLFLPITDKITACVPGNHEARITKEVGTCPLYDLCVRWDIADVYRESLAITKYVFGTHPSCKGRGLTYIGITTHGSTRNKHKKFIAGFDGIDFAVSAHTHTPEYSPHGKIRVDNKSATARHVPYKEIVVDAYLKPGGYSLSKEYDIAPPPEIQYIELSAYRDGRGNTRKTHKVIDYHAMQI